MKSLAMVGLAANFCLLIFSAISNYATIDEARCVPAGLVRWQTGTFQLGSDIAPLSKMIATLPLFFTDFEVVTDGSFRKKTAIDVEQELKITSSFWYSNIEFTLRILFTARFLNILWWAAGAWVIFRWSREAHGEHAGWLGLLLWSFEPSVLAREQLATPDLAVAVTCLAATYAFCHWLRAPSWMGASSAGLLLGIAQVIDFAALSLYVIWPLLALIHCLKGERQNPSTGMMTRAAQIVLIFAVSLGTINIGYDFSYADNTSRKDGVPRDRGVENDTAGRNRFRGIGSGSIILPLPTDYLAGIDRKWHAANARFESSSSDTRRLIDRGTLSLQAFLAKVSVGTLIFLAWSIGLAVCRYPDGAHLRDELSILIPLVVIPILAKSPLGFLFPASSMLMMIPFVIICGSRIAFFLRVGSWRSRGVIATLLCSVILSGLVWCRHSLYYVNEVARTLTNEAARASYIAASEYGQDLFALKDWLADHPEANFLGLGFRHVIDPRAYGVEYSRLPRLPKPERSEDVWSDERIGPQPGYYAVDLHHLVLSQYQYFLQLQPTFRVGASIFIYRITEDDANRSRSLLGLANKRDLLTLKDWHGRHSEANPLGLVCQAGVNVRDYGFDTLRPPSYIKPTRPDDHWLIARNGPRPGYYAIDLYSLASTEYRYFSQFRPVFQAGASILVYHLTEEHARQARFGLGLPPIEYKSIDRTRVKDHGFLHRVHRDSQGLESHYTVFIPHDYDGGKSYPVILFLHGYGDRGLTGTQYLRVGFPPAIKRREADFDFIAICPQGHTGAWWPEGDDAIRAMEILARVESEYNVDRRRVYLTGLSSGGAGVWALAARYPDVWAAIVPVSPSACNPYDAPRIKDIACWCFHRRIDVSAHPEISRSMIRALKEVGGKPRYTEFFEALGDTHNAWDEAYNAPELYEWLARTTK